MPDPREQQFAEALLAMLGDRVCYRDLVGGITSPAPGITRLLQMKNRNAAFYQN